MASLHESFFNGAGGGEECPCAPKADYTPVVQYLNRLLAMTISVNLVTLLLPKHAVTPTKLFLE